MRGAWLPWPGKTKATLIAGWHLVVAMYPGDGRVNVNVDIDVGVGPAAVVKALLGGSGRAV